MYSLIYGKIHHFYLPTHIFSGLRPDSPKIFFSKLLVILIPFLSFKEITHASLLKISIAYNKTQIKFSYYIYLLIAYWLGQDLKL